MVRDSDDNNSPRHGIYIDTEGDAIVPGVAGDGKIDRLKVTNSVTVLPFVEGGAPATFEGDPASDVFTATNKYNAMTKGPNFGTCSNTDANGTNDSPGFGGGSKPAVCNVEVVTKAEMGTKGAKTTNSTALGGMEVKNTGTYPVGVIDNGTSLNTTGTNPYIGAKTE